MPYIYIRYLLEKVESQLDLIKVEFNELEKDLYLILQKKKYKEIEEYQTLICNFFNYFNSEIKKLVQIIISNYMGMNERKWDISFLVKVIFYDIYCLNDFRERILNRIKNDIKEENTVEGVKVYPDSIKLNSEHLLNLFNSKFVTKEEILDLNVVEKLKGVNPFLDWNVFGVKTEKELDYFFKHPLYQESFKNLIDITESDKELIKEWFYRKYINKI